jgi:hypothetical protein
MRASLLIKHITDWANSASPNRATVCIGPTTSTSDVVNETNAPDWRLSRYFGLRNGAASRGKPGRAKQGVVHRLVTVIA